MSRIVQGFDLKAYAREVEDPQMKSFDQLKAEIIESGKLESFKEELQRGYQKGRINLVVLGTGGTFQSAQTDRGIAPSGSLEESFEAMKMPYNRDEIKLNLFEIFNYDSSLLATGEHIRFIAEVLIELLQDCSGYIEGFILTHGTDTMVETANYLSLILGRGLKKPIIITGSQDPARTKHSDAVYHMDNCLKAQEFLRDHKVAEVMVLCGNQLVRGAWAEKVSDKNSDAFEAYNGKPLLDVGNKVVKRWTLADFVLTADATVPFYPSNTVTESADIPVTKLSDLSTEHLAQLIKGNRISVFTLLGSATCPNTHAQVLKIASEHGKPVVLRSPFHDSILSTGTYQAGSALMDSRIPQVKGTESFIRAKLNWLWHYLGLNSKSVRGLGHVVSARGQAQLYTAMCQNMVGEWDEDKS